MKVTVKVDERYFEVEIENLHTRPITATVEGETFEVWPAGGFAAQSLETQSVGISGAPPSAGASSSQVASQFSAQSTTQPTTQPAANAPGAGHDAKAVYAPIPGVMVSIDVETGDTVTVGQQLCVLEAMKMKNSIRAPRAGQIASIFVASGDHVKHHDLLMEFND